MELSNVLDIRAARRSDFDQLLALFDQVAAEGQWIGTEPGFDRDKYRAAWQDIIDGKGGAHLVASQGSKIVGALSLYPTANDSHDLGMLVSQERRGQGVGTALLHEAFAWARAQGIPKLTLGVFPHNETAISLYENLGFVAVRRLERKKVRQTGDIWDVIVMEKQMWRPQAVESAGPAHSRDSGRNPVILLREIDDTVLEELLAVAESEATPDEVMPPVAGPPGWNDGRRAAFRSFHRSRRDGLDGPHGEVTFVIFYRNRVVGSGRLARSAPGTLETGMWIARSARGSGIGTKALKALKQRAAAEGANRLIARTTQRNEAAIGALRNSGAEIGQPDEHGHIWATLVNPDARC